MMSNHIKLNVGLTECPLIAWQNPQNKGSPAASQFRLTFSHVSILPQLINFKKSLLLVLVLLCTCCCLVIGWHSKLENYPENGKQWIQVSLQREINKLQCWGLITDCIVVICRNICISKSDSQPISNYQTNTTNSMSSLWVRQWVTESVKPLTNL